MDARTPNEEEVKEAVDSLVAGGPRESKDQNLSLLRSVKRASPEILEELLLGITSSADADTRLACALAIGRCGDGAQTVIPAIRSLLLPSPLVEKSIAMGLVLTVANIHCSEAIALYREILRGEDFVLKFIALQCLRSPKAFRLPLREEVRKLSEDEILGGIARSLLDDKD